MQKEKKKNWPEAHNFPLLPKVDPLASKKR